MNEKIVIVGAGSVGVDHVIGLLSAGKTVLLVASKQDEKRNQAFDPPPIEYIMPPREQLCEVVKPTKNYIDGTRKMKKKKR